jgi:hypothetical protein
MANSLQGTIDSGQEIYQTKIQIQNAVHVFFLCVLCVFFIFHPYRMNGIAMALASGTMRKKYP